MEFGWAENIGIITMKTIKNQIKSKLVNPLLFLITIASFHSCAPKVQNLPFLGEHDTYTRQEGGKSITDTTYYKVPDFSLTDQDSLTLTQEFVDNKVYVSYFFFTSCPATCPIMTRAMERVYSVVGENEDFMVLAHTVDPKRDTPSKLKSFAIENDIDKDNWRFLTADMDYIYDLGMKGYYLSMGQHDAAPGGYIHSSRIILLDRNKHIRGMYEGTDANEVAELIKGIQYLLGE